MAKGKKTERHSETLANCENVRDPNVFLQELLRVKVVFNQDINKERLHRFMDAIGNPDRFLILDSLKRQSRCVCELESIIDKSQPTVSHHLKLLERMQLIRGWKKGRFTYYSLVRKTFDEFNSLWNAWHDGISNWFGD